MRSHVSSLVRHASARPARFALSAIVMAFGFATAGQALAAPTLPASSLSASTQASRIDGRADWNVDYPSQLGPDGPLPESAATGSPRTSDADTRAAWNVDYPSQLGPDGVQRDQRQAPIVESEVRVYWNVDYPSQLGPDGPSPKGAVAALRSSTESSKSMLP
ncbi:hypothetical protein DVT68_00670 [Dyella solisilvae]|uniref:Uncharacterized protein n=1 Tax=Dyella solisilvae TaxID=1920168 RepID=A0A370K9T1_9GAMM|nr:hypothetical protein [Dyella solisilvae]RDI99411.1 hypothetical protein DVT68_00670 [Dyella solisilvae]